MPTLEARLASFQSHRARMVIVPLDHGVHDGPIDGLRRMHRTIAELATGGVDGLVLHKGMIRRHRERLTCPYFLHVSASTALGNWLHKVIVASPAEAIRLGATGISVHVNLGNPHEPQMLADLGRIVGLAHEQDLPVLAMVYVREIIAGEVVNHTDIERVRHAVRVAAELGADVVKAPYTGCEDSFADVVESCPVPVVVAGGTVADEADVLNVVRAAMRVGGAGVSMGRNIFQAPDVGARLSAVQDVVYTTDRARPETLV